MLMLKNVIFKQTPPLCTYYNSAQTKEDSKGGNYFDSVYEINIIFRYNNPLCTYYSSAQTKEDSKGGKPLAVLRGRVQREGENRNFPSLCAFFAILSWHQESMKKEKS